jgi:hypothetical protein
VPCVPLIHGRRRGFHDSANLNLAKRRLCDALVGISLGSTAHCCAISVASVRAARTASIPRSNRPLPRRTNFGAAKSCFLVIIFMIRPPTAQSGESNYAHQSRPYHGSRNSGDSERPTGAFAPTQRATPPAARQRLRPDARMCGGEVSSSPLRLAKVHSITSSGVELVGRRHDGINSVST